MRIGVALGPDPPPESRADHRGVPLAPRRGPSYRGPHHIHPNGTMQPALFVVRHSILVRTGNESDNRFPPRGGGATPNPVRLSYRRRAPPPGGVGDAPRTTRGAGDFDGHRDRGFPRYRSVPQDSSSHPQRRREVPVVQDAEPQPMDESPPAPFSGYSQVRHRRPKGLLVRAPRRGSLPRVGDHRLSASVGFRRGPIGGLGPARPPRRSGNAPRTQGPLGRRPRSLTHPLGRAGS